MLRHLPSAFVLALLPLVSMLGCEDATSPEPDEAGTFNANTSGAASRAFSGPAVFTPDVPGAEYGFAIALVDSVTGAEPGVRHAVYLYREDGGAPATGEHQIGAQNPFRGGVVLDGDGDDPLLCVAEAGSLQITNIAPAAVRGSFDMQAICFLVGDPLTRDTLQASGSFRAMSGIISVPEDVSEMPAVQGRLELLTANGSPVPTSVFDGIVLVGDDNFVHLEITVTGGYIELDSSGGYEHRVAQEVRVDGQPAPSLNWVDRGTCVPTAAGLACMSSMVANRGFSASIGEGTLEVDQDLNGEGVAVTYRYAPGG